MNGWKSIGNSLAWLACLVILFPAPLFESQTHAAELLRIVDVALQSQGVLSGHVRSEQGSALPNEPVVISQSGRAFAQTTTDSTGYFMVSGLSGGLYEVATAGSTVVCRAWTAEAAPPAARDFVVVGRQRIVRGQDREPLLSSRLVNLAALGLSVTALTLSITLPLVLNEDEDAS